MYKIGQSGGVLGRILAPLLKCGFYLMYNVLKQLTKNVLTPLGFTPGFATNTAVHEKIFGSSTYPIDLAKQTKLIISNEEMNDIMKIVKPIEETGLLIKGISETFQNESKKQKGGFPSMFIRS